MSLLTAITGQRIYLDTNVFIYALEGFLGLDRQLREFFEAMENNAFTGYMSEIAIGEALVKPLQVSDQSLLAAYDDTFQNRPYFQMLPITRPILREAARLRGATKMKLYDAIHLATAEMLGCTTLVTNDTGFRNKASMPVLLLSDFANTQPSASKKN